MGVNVPRIDYANGCPELLVENEATNLLLRSQEFNNASWTKSANVGVTANSTTAPDGTLTADESTNYFTSQISIFQSGINAITNACASIYVKKGTNRYFGLTINGTNDFNSRFQGIFDLNNGTLYGVNNSSTPLTNTSTFIETLINGWYRISVSATFITSANPFVTLQHSNIIPTLAGNNLEWINATNGNCYIWGAQIEQGNKATSYIPTTTATVTRPADNVRNNTLGYDNEESTIFVRARLNFTTDYQGIATLWDGDDFYNGYIIMYYYISGGVRYIAFDTYNFNGDLNQYLYTAPSDGVYSIAFAYHTGERTYKIAINGVLITDDEFPYNFPSYTLLTQMTLGSFLTYFNSRTKGFMYFDSMLDNDSLENLTVQ